MATFVEANTLEVKAFMAAIDEAQALIAKDRKGAIDSYPRATKEKTLAEELPRISNLPGTIDSSTPSRTMLFAEQMAKTGQIKTKPTDWKDYHSRAIHDPPGS